MKTDSGRQEDGKSNPVMRKKRDGYDTEDPFQIEAAAFFDFCLPKPDAWWCHVPNGGKRAMTTARRLKAMGTKAGAPDNLIIYQGRAYWIELKARYGSLQDSQKSTIPVIESAGSPVAIARTLEDIADALSSWGIPLRATMEAFLSRHKPKAIPQRMSASDYRAVMGLDAGSKPKKAVIAWQRPTTATRRRLLARVKSPA